MVGAVLAERAFVAELEARLGLVEASELGEALTEQAVGEHAALPPSAPGSIRTLSRRDLSRVTVLRLTKGDVSGAAGPSTDVKAGAVRQI